MAPLSAHHSAQSYFPGPTTPQQQADVLGLDPEVSERIDHNASVTRKGRPRTKRQPEDIPQDRDTVGETVATNFEYFLKEFTDTPQSGDDSQASYIEQIHTMRVYELTTLYVDFTHILKEDDVLAGAIQTQYYRFQPYLRCALRTVVAEFEPEYVNLDFATTDSVKLQTKEFDIAFFNLPLVSSIRDIRSSKIGTLISINGNVTRTSEVRPELLFGSFSCQACKVLVHNIEQQFKYTEPSLCSNPTCGNRRAWQLHTERSKFTDWQKVRIQESPSEIPTGCMPRSLDVVVRSEMVERAKAGDKCLFTGTLIAVPNVGQLVIPSQIAQLNRQPTWAGGQDDGVTGLKALGVRDLQYQLAFLACMVQNANAACGTDICGDEYVGEEAGPRFMSSLTEPEYDELKVMINSDNIYSQLVASIVPTVYGNNIVKKGLLLQLLGGVPKQTGEGMHLRGDINVCIVGDPSTSKSQLLKYICSLVPRAVYTSGKGSSAAGLTAAIVKDEETGNFTVEAGALTLADSGICAIDEFDKMNLSDQVAIHEAMEQQTISISKAGIHVTFKARTSLLAAANPIGGRYDRQKPLRANIQMSAPILTRFDLFFILLDECDKDSDRRTAQHIVYLHRYQDEAIQPLFSTEALQRYIRYARTINPKITPEAAELLVRKYRILRQHDAGAGQNSYRITVRQLESMIRLSEAVARAHCADKVIPTHVLEAYNLLCQSIIQVEHDDVDLGEDEDDLQQSSAQDSTPNDTSGHQFEDSGSGERSASTARKMIMRYDEYNKLKNLIVCHLSRYEQENGQGLDRDSLIDWYLETKEEEAQSVVEIDAEKELMTKMLRKLVKENHLIEIRGDVLTSLPKRGEFDTLEEECVYYMVHPSVDVNEA